MGRKAAFVIHQMQFCCLRKVTGSTLKRLEKQRNSQCNKYFLRNSFALIIKFICVYKLTSCPSFDEIRISMGSFFREAFGLGHHVFLCPGAKPKKAIRALISGVFVQMNLPKKKKIDDFKKPTEAWFPLHMGEFQSHYAN